MVRLPDGSWLWLGPVGDDDRLLIPWKEYNKLLSELEQLRKQVQNRKPIPPSQCMIHVRIERRGNQQVAVVRLQYAFRTTGSQTAVLLGGRRGLLTAASLDGVRLPALESNDDGYVAVVPTAGEHTLVLTMELPVGPRGTKAEPGVEIALPRSPITTLQFDPADQNITQLNLVSRMSDPSQPSRPAELRRMTAVPVQQLLPQGGSSHGYPLGPIESLEITWPLPPLAPAGDAVQTAEAAVTVEFTDSHVETTGRILLRGPARKWRLLTPPQGVVTAERASGEFASGTAPIIQRLGGGAKNEWQVEFPPGTAVTDWVITVSLRQPRPRPEDPAYRGPYTIGPLKVMDVVQYSGTLRLVAPPHHRFAVRPRPELRRVESPAAEDDRSLAVFRWHSGGTLGVAPLLTVEIHPLRGHLLVQPQYQLHYTPLGWRVRADVKIHPVRREIDAVLLEIPAAWRNVEAAPPEIVDGLQTDVAAVGFWRQLAQRLAPPQYIPMVIRLTNTYRQPLELTLNATVPIAATAAAMVPLPYFPNASVTECNVEVIGPESGDIQGEWREWEGTTIARWSQPLSRLAASSSSFPRGRVQLSGKTDRAAAAVYLNVQQARQDIRLANRVDVTVQDRQIVVQQTLRVRGAEALPQQLHLDGPTAAAGLSSRPPLEASVPGQWRWPIPAEQREAVVQLSYSLPGGPSPAVNRWTVPFFQLREAAESETIVRVWSATTVPHRIRVVLDDGWRELPPELVPEQEAVPLGTLLSTQSTRAVQLEMTPVEEKAALVWVDRGVLQAWAGADGVVRYRVRLLVRRWAVPAAEVLLRRPVPQPMAWYLNGRAVQAELLAVEGETHRYRVPLPDSSSGGALLEIRYAQASPKGSEVVCDPPELNHAVWNGPLRGHILLPPFRLPLWLSGAEPLWEWMRPIGRNISDPAVAVSLEQWLQDRRSAPLSPQGDAEVAAEAVAFQQLAPGTIRLRHVPRGEWTIGSSLVLILMVLLAGWLPRAWSGWLVAATATLAGIIAWLSPLTVLTFLVGGSWGLIAGVLLLVLASLWRWARTYRRRRVATFRRGRTLAAPPPRGGAPPAAPLAAAAGPSTPTAPRLSGVGPAAPVPTPSGG